MSSQLPKETEHGFLHFTVDGKFLMDLARDGYWFEGRQEWALDLLACCQGITTEQTMKVLRGDAVLYSVESSEQIFFEERQDPEFKARLKAHQDWLVERELQRQKALEESIKSHEAEWDELERRAQLISKASKLREEMMQPRPEKPKELKPPIHPAAVGKFQVEKELLDQYLSVAVEHDTLEYRPEGWDAGSALLWSGRMMKIHLRLRESVGLEGYWGRTPQGEEDDFDKALSLLVEKAVKSDKRYIDGQRIKRSRRDGLA